MTVRRLAVPIEDCGRGEKADIVAAMTRETKAGVTKRMKTTITAAAMLLAATFSTAGHAAGGGAREAAMAGAEGGATITATATGATATKPETAGGDAAGTRRPDIVSLALSKKNPMVQMVLAMNEACPSDVLGLMRDLGELAGLVDAPEVQLPAGGSFADKMKALAAQRNVGKSLLDRMLSRSCLYNRLFGDGTCGK
ncbi:MAG TPA: hypothetical protein ENJ62_00150 [Bryobacterales bacterium]|nr:hypothetical protein [Bryobacterales bacterium]